MSDRFCLSCGYWRATCGVLCDTCAEDTEYALTALWDHHADRDERDTDHQGDAHAE